ncbi:uncharacterized protein LOC113380188 [Ctenocephalides felis]|uniref:uncharacterized protein LOC113380188 n=1 Tax=Ctenocephalides felis TaxID=7515 RepID=UPI000E6E1800|nr:uncharacterized protein LOC113380188 [Ctenocephalides felis]
MLKKYLEYMALLILCKFDSIFRAVQSVNEDENHLRKRLIYSLLLEINDLVCSVMKLTSTLEKSTGELRNKFNEFEQSVKDYDFPENSILTNGNSLQPSLSELLELANDSWTYYEAYIGEIQISLQIANLTKEAEIENILEILKRNLNDNDIDDFIAITQFCEQVDVSTT